MEIILIRRHEESGFKPLDDEILYFRAYGYAKHLLNMGVQPKDFEYIYELATIIYNATPPQGPFGIDHLIQAAKRFKESSKKFVTYQKPEGKKMVSCTSCQGSRIAFKYLDGKVIGMERDADGKVKACEDCSGL